MAKIQEKLADSLQELQKLQQGNNNSIIRSSDLSRIHIVRLVDNGFLLEVIPSFIPSLFLVLSIFFIKLFSGHMSNL